MAMQVLLKRIIYRLAEDVSYENVHLLYAWGIR